MTSPSYSSPVPRGLLTPLFLWERVVGTALLVLMPFNYVLNETKEPSQCFISAAVKQKNRPLVSADALAQLAADFL